MQKVIIASLAVALTAAITGIIVMSIYFVRLVKAVDAISMYHGHGTAEQ